MEDGFLVKSKDLEIIDALNDDGFNDAFRAAVSYDPGEPDNSIVEQLLAQTEIMQQTLDQITQNAAESQKELTAANAKSFRLSLICTIFTIISAIAATVAAVAALIQLQL